MSPTLDPGVCSDAGSDGKWRNGFLVLGGENSVSAVDCIAIDVTAVKLSGVLVGECSASVQDSVVVENEYLATVEVDGMLVLRFLDESLKRSDCVEQSNGAVSPRMQGREAPKVVSDPLDLSSSVS